MRILSIIQPSEMSEDFYFDPDIGKWRVNFPEDREGQKQLKNIVNATENGYYSTAYGFSAVADSFSVAIGTGAISETSGTAIGYQAKAAAYCVSYGYFSKSESFLSTALGIWAESMGDCSLAVGVYAKARGSYTTSIGAYATSESESGTCVGANSGVPRGCENSTAIGYGASTTTSNQASIGNVDVTLVASNVQSLSDARDKTNIRDADLGLSFINSLRPVVYQFDYREKYFNLLYKLPNREDFENIDDYKNAMIEYEHQRKNFYTNPVKDGSLAGKRSHYGLIAQEFKQTLDDLGVDHAAYQHHEISGGCDVHSIGYVELVPNLILAVQELTTRNRELETRLEILETQ